MPQSLAQASATNSIAFERAEAAKIHACPEPGCKSRFKRRSGLTSHSKTHLTKEKKMECSHKCNDCGKCFLQYGNFKTHQRKHNGRTLLCPNEGCNYNNPDLGTLIRHRKQVHGYIAHSGHRTPIEEVDRSSIPDSVVRDSPAFSLILPPSQRDDLSPLSMGVPSPASLPTLSVLDPICTSSHMNEASLMPSSSSSPSSGAELASSAPTLPTSSPLLSYYPAQVAHHQSHLEQHGHYAGATPPSSPSSSWDAILDPSSPLSPLSDHLPTSVPPSSPSYMTQQDLAYGYLQQEQQQMLPPLNESGTTASSSSMHTFIADSQPQSIPDSLWTVSPFALEDIPRAPSPSYPAQTSFNASSDNIMDSSLATSYGVSEPAQMPRDTQKPVDFCSKFAAWPPGGHHADTPVLSQPEFPALFVEGHVPVDVAQYHVSSPRQSTQPHYFVPLQDVPNSPSTSATESHPRERRYRSVKRFRHRFAPYLITLTPKQLFAAAGAGKTLEGLNAAVAWYYSLPYPSQILVADALCGANGGWSALPAALRDCVAFFCGASGSAGYTRVDAGAGAI